MAVSMRKTKQDQQMFLFPTGHLGKPASIDLTITSQLNSTFVSDAGVKAGSAAQAAECRKHHTNDTQ